MITVKLHDEIRLLLAQYTGEAHDLYLTMPDYEHASDAQRREYDAKESQLMEKYTFAIMRARK